MGAISGGLADKENKSPKDFPFEQLVKGVKVEKEHTPDLDARLDVTMDHLTEKDKYYNDPMFAEEVKKPIPASELKRLGEMYALKKTGMDLDYFSGANKALDTLYKSANFKNKFMELHNKWGPMGLARKTGDWIGQVGKSAINKAGEGATETVGKLKTQGNEAISDLRSQGDAALSELQSRGNSIADDLIAKVRKGVTEGVGDNLHDTMSRVGKGAAKAGLGIGTGVAATVGLPLAAYHGVKALSGDK